MIKSYLRLAILYIVTFIANKVIQQHKPYIIGITGNLGKTSTKENIATVTSDLNTLYSKKSLNSEFGIPLTILMSESGWSSASKWLRVIINGIKIYFAKSYPEYLILEIGADKKGDIESVTKWIKPDLVVLTPFSEVPVHVENFRNREELVREKRYLPEALKKNGIFIYNADCKDSVKIAEHIKQKSYSYGIRYGNYRAGVIVDSVKDKKVSSQVITPANKNIHLELYGVLGEASIICALPSLIISDILGLDINRSAELLRNASRQPGRMRVLDGKFGSTIIDDSYNSSPLACETGLKTIRNIKSMSRKIAILGDMLELGEYTMGEHKRIGNIAKDSVDVLITVGTRARLIAEGAKAAGMKEGYILECKTSEEAGHEVLNILKEKDIVYIKGSQGMRMERATKQLVSDKVDVANDLPRHDVAWLSIK